MATPLEAVEFQQKLDTMQETIEALSREISKLKKEKQNLHAALKKATSSERKSEDAVSGGASQADAKALLAARLGFGAPKSKSPGGGGVVTGASPTDAKSLLGAMFLKKKAPALGSGSAEDGADEPYAAVLKKYEKMMKLGIGVHGAIGRMTQDGIDKDIIAHFRLKHAELLGGGKGADAKVSAVELGLKPKRRLKKATKEKVKRLHWEPIALTDIPSTLWADIDDSVIKYNAKELEALFCVKLKRRVTRKKPAKKKDDGGFAKHEFLPKKRSQQVQIGLKALGQCGFRDVSSLRQCLLDMDESKMTVESLQTLLEIAPSMEEQMQAEKESISQSSDRFGDAESFFYNLCDFYNLQQRLRMWQFKMQFGELKSMLLSQVTVVQKCCDKVKRSKKLKLLLTILLAFGNRLNLNTKKGDCYGFRIEVLPDLTGLKTMDGRRNILTHLYAFCDKTPAYADALQVTDELVPLLKQASHIESEVTHKAFDRMQQSLKDIESLVESGEAEEYEFGDKFLDVLATFYRSEAKSLRTLKMRVNSTSARSKSLLKVFYFGGEDCGSGVRIEHMFKVLLTFMNDLEQSKHTLLRIEKELAKKRAKRLRQMQKRAKGMKGLRRMPPPAPESALTGLEKMAQEKLAFMESLTARKKELKHHVRQMSIVVRTGGITAPPSRQQSAHFKRVSIVVRGSMAAIEDAKKKADELRKKKQTAGFGSLEEAARFSSSGSWRDLGGESRFTSGGWQPTLLRNLSKTSFAIREDEEEEEGDYGLEAPKAFKRKSSGSSERKTKSPSDAMALTESVTSPVPSKYTPPPTRRGHKSGGSKKRHDPSPPPTSVSMSQSPPSSGTSSKSRTGHRKARKGAESRKGKRPHASAGQRGADAHSQPSASTDVSSTRSHTMSPKRTTAVAFKGSRGGMSPRSSRGTDKHRDRSDPRSVRAVRSGGDEVKKRGRGHSAQLHSERVIVPPPPPLETDTRPRKRSAPPKRSLPVVPSGTGVVDPRARKLTDRTAKSRTTKDRRTKDKGRRRH